MSSENDVEICVKSFKNFYDYSNYTFSLSSFFLSLQQIVSVMLFSYSYHVHAQICPTCTDVSAPLLCHYSIHHIFPFNSEY